MKPNAARTTGLKTKEHVKTGLLTIQQAKAQLEAHGATGSRTYAWLVTRESQKTMKQKAQ